MTTARCPTCDRPSATAELAAHKGGCVCASCLAHCWREWGVMCDPAPWRARAIAAEADAARWHKVAPLIERLADDVRRRELIARAEFDRRVSDTVTAMLAATESTP